MLGHTEAENFGDSISTYGSMIFHRPNVIFYPKAKFTIDALELGNRYTGLHLTITVKDMID